MLKLIQQFDYLFQKNFIKLISIVFIIYLISFEFIFLLNDELIFDSVLISLLLFINKTFSNKNYIAEHANQIENKNLYIFIFSYLKNWNYFIIRKKKLEKLVLISFLNLIQQKLINILNSFFSNINNYITNEIYLITRKKYYFLIIYKQINLIQATLNSFKTKLFYI